MVGRGMRLYVNAMKRKKYERVAMRKEFLWGKVKLNGVVRGAEYAPSYEKGVMSRFQASVMWACGSEVRFTVWQALCSRGSEPNGPYGQNNNRYIAISDLAQRLRATLNFRGYPVSSHPESDESSSHQNIVFPYIRFN
jgi:hypothetical protein